MRHKSWFARNRWRYPDNWEEIARQVKSDAHWRCEACGCPHQGPYVLTVDHLDHDPGNSATSNLVALCQRCHLMRQGLSPKPTTKAEAIRRLELKLNAPHLQLPLEMGHTDR